MLSLEETYSDTLALTDAVSCDVSLTEAALTTHPADSVALYRLIHEKLPLMWPLLAHEISDNPWIRQSAEKQQRLHFSVILTTDEEMHQLNRDFRGKDSSTDVLTFSLLEDAAERIDFSALPELSLGEIYLSVCWAKAVVCKEFQENPKYMLNFFHGLTLFILERVVHGCLHVVGVHHDTEPDYNRVVAIQRLVIHAVTEENN